MTHHLLIVDDEPLNLEILSEYFDGQGYRLSMAEKRRGGLGHAEAASGTWIWCCSTA